MDPINDYTPIHGMIDSIAARAVVHIDKMTLGQHPDGAARDEGNLALLDWSVAGGSIVADGWEASVILTRRTSPARALGAALAAAAKVDDQICEHLPLLSGLASGSENLASRSPGGPADAALRLALCARGLAFASRSSAAARWARFLGFQRWLGSAVGGCRATRVFEELAVQHSRGG